MLNSGLADRPLPDLDVARVPSAALVSHERWSTVDPERSRSSRCAAVETEAVHGFDVRPVVELTCPCKQGQPESSKVRFLNGPGFQCQRQC